MKAQLFALALILTLGGCNQTNGKYSPAQIARNERDDIRSLADEVVSGDKSFEEAGCEHSGGDWDDNREICNRDFFIRKSDTEDTQDSILAERIDVLAQQSSDHDAAVSAAQEAAKAWLDDHPEDHRGAMGRAIGAVRKASLLTGLTKERQSQLGQLSQPTTFTKFYPSGD